MKQYIPPKPEPRLNPNNPEDRAKIIDKAVSRTIKEYRKTLEALGKPTTPYEVTQGSKSLPWHEIISGNDEILLKQVKLLRSLVLTLNLIAIISVLLWIILVFSL